MPDYRNRISTHTDNDDWRHYEFVRNSRLPHGTFGRGINIDAVVVGACIVALFVGLLALWIVELMP